MKAKAKRSALAAEMQANRDEFGGPRMTQAVLDAYQAKQAAAASALAPMMSAAEKVQKALMHLVLHKPFFGSLILRLNVREDHQGHKTCWTDGRALRYNAAFVLRVSFDNLCFILAHEVGHCALAHPYRRGARKQELFNNACDHAVNALLVEDGTFAMPENATYDPRFKGWHAEAIYAVLLSEQEAEEQAQQKQQCSQPGGIGDQGGDGKEQEQSQEKSGDPDEEVSAKGDTPNGENSNSGSDDSDESDSNQGEADDGSQQDESLADSPGTEHGDVLDAGTSGPVSDEDESEGIEDSSPESLSEAQQQQEMQEWLAAAAAAAMDADAMGKMAAGAMRVITDSFEPMQTYAEYLRLFCSRFSKDDETWSRGNRRLLSQGIYLASMRSESVGKLIIAIDTSGSISKRDLAHFQAEMQAIHSELKPEELIVLYCDEKVHTEQRIGRYDQVEFDLNLVKGGGGTDFRPPFKWAHVKREEGEDIIGVIYVTDLDGDFPTQKEKWFDPMLPVLWVASDKLDVPFGEVCYLFNR